jgi:hypothetical protein
MESLVVLVLMQLELSVLIASLLVLLSTLFALVVQLSVLTVVHVSLAGAVARGVAEAM